ncbi:MAG: hypothetical protein RL325_788 [Planctomycetota bacterium]
MAIATTARIASPFQSLRTDAPDAPSTAIHADRTALAAGAMMQRAARAMIATTTACPRASRMTRPAAAAVTHASTVRLKPEIARMCASPTARKSSSTAR